MGTSSSRPLLFFICCALALVLVRGAAGATLHVPQDHATIQAAILAASPGDEVLVAPGTYGGRVDFLEKGIRVASSGGPAVTFIEHDEGPTVVFQSGEGLDAVLEGFTVRAPLPTGIMAGGSGVGIQCLQSSPTIRNNRITGNFGLGDGGGISLFESSARIEGNEIVENTSVCVTQFGVCGAGGGLHIVGGAPHLIGNRIADNVAPGFGGAIYIGAGTQAVLRDNQISGNASAAGGGVAIDFQASAVLDNNLVTLNVAGGFTSLAGIFDGVGGGLFAVQGAILTMRSCTIASNSTLMPSGPGVGLGGGLWIEDGATLTLENSIAWGNSAATGTDLGHGPAAILTVRYSDVGGLPVAGTGNLDADPLFVAGTYLSQVASGQGADSPALDAGDPTAAAIPGTTRTDGGADAGVLDLGYHASAGLARLVRGDCNADTATNLADAVTLLGFLFPGPTPVSLSCLDACDASDDGGLDIGDAVTLLGALFGSPAVPLAPPASCGADTTQPNLGCAQFAACP